jgi:hypothetical protein
MTCSLNAAGMTRFYCLQLYGRKLVRLLPPSEFYRVPSSDNEQFLPMLFAANLFNPDFKAHPSMDGVLVYEALLEAGDVLYIPEGWGHQTLNLEWGLMVSSNYIDRHDMPSVWSRIRFATVCPCRCTRLNP